MYPSLSFHTPQKPSGFVESFLNDFIPLFSETYIGFTVLMAQLSSPASVASFAKE